MIDKAALFTDLTQRNVLRRAAHLPLLDLKSELARITELAIWKDATEAHADDLVQIRTDVISEMKDTHGADFDASHSAGARWLIDLTVNKRFVLFLESLGFRQPKFRIVHEP